MADGDMSVTSSSTPVSSLSETSTNVSTYTPGTLLNVLTSTQEVVVGVTSSTRGTTLNESWYDSNLRNNSLPVSSQQHLESQVYGVIPGICVGIAMVVFLGISFFHYHRRFRRKRKLALEYVGFTLDNKRPRIAAPGCFVNLQQLNDVGTLQVQESDSGSLGQSCSNVELHDVPISVKFHTSGNFQSNSTISNPVFQMDENDVEETGFKTLKSDLSHSFSEQDVKTKDEAQVNPREVELRLSELCSHCAGKVLSSSNTHQIPDNTVQKRPPGPSVRPNEESRWSNHDDYEMMDAFHGRSQLRERRRPSMPTPVNRFGFKAEGKELSKSMLLCPYCFSGKWQSTHL